MGKLTILAAVIKRNLAQSDIIILSTPLRSGCYGGKSCGKRIARGPANSSAARWTAKFMSDHVEAKHQSIPLYQE